MQKFFLSAIRSQYFFVFMCLVGAFWYVERAKVYPNSLNYAYLTWSVDSPFVFRFLVPYTLAYMLPDGWSDTRIFRIIFAFLSLVACAFLLPAFVRRWFADSPRLESNAKWGFFVVFVAHYCLRRDLSVYYSYDLPSIILYLIAFLLLTSQRSIWRWVGVFCVCVFAMNRETIVIAVVHALVWHLSMWRGALSKMAKENMHYLIEAGISVVLILMVRQLTVLFLDQGFGSSFSWYEDDQIRVLANIERMATRFTHGITLIWFGAGVLFWLPRIWRFMPRQIKNAVLATLPFFLLYCLTGNFVELRMFCEFVPLLAVMLGCALTWHSAPSSSEVRGTTVRS